MHLNLIVEDIHKREEALTRCKSSLHSMNVKKNPAEIQLLEQQIFYLQDQLAQLYSVAAILKEEQGVYDEMLPKV